MANNSRVLNVSRGFSMKYKHALRAIEEGACAWVEPGVSIRNLTLAESIAFRQAQAKQREPLPWAELPGLHFESGRPAADVKEMQLVREANTLVSQM